ncbi:FGGY-family carbohydrate kinase [Brevibacillus sp. B_LB10_24]|uniref:FGGY-family carbohydrate kinase n=1 Tax=Brevibacillus sp. B_LB10_24 TaxID=3380645 RepID=UPI0038BB9B15
MKKGYLIVDISTGNASVGIASITGEVLALESSVIQYHKDADFPDSHFFQSQPMWENIIQLAKEVQKKAPDVEILAVSSTSQRQGIVLLDRDGNSLIGFPNIDNRGLEWESDIKDFDKVYGLTGRWISTLFSALKLRGVKEKQPYIWEKISAFTSISDWIGYECTGKLVYEPSQASETSLFDVGQGKWSKELCELFGIEYAWLPEIRESGSILGKIKPELAKELNLSPETLFIVGGADTQLAVKGTQPELGDIVIVSGTTTPITKVVDRYTVDSMARCWGNRYVNPGEFVIETNAGVSGLNYQRLKSVFFPDKDYAEIEDEVLQLKHPTCVASFGTLVFDKNLPLSKGGFLLDAPAHQDVTAADFVFAIIFDIACSIKHNFDVLLDISPSGKDYILGCGGGFQGKVLPQLLADLLQKEIRIKQEYKQASIAGGVIICNEALQIESPCKSVLQTFTPSHNEHLHSLYQKWAAFRSQINER